MAWKFYDFVIHTAFQQKNFWFQYEFQITYGRDFFVLRFSPEKLKKKNHLTCWKYCTNRKGIQNIYLSPAYFPIHPLTFRTGTKNHRERNSHLEQAEEAGIESKSSRKYLNPYQALTESNSNDGEVFSANFHVRGEKVFLYPAELFKAGRVPANARDTRISISVAVFGNGANSAGMKRQPSMGEFVRERDCQSVIEKRESKHNKRHE